MVAETVRPVLTLTDWQRTWLRCDVYIEESCLKLVVVLQAGGSRQLIVQAADDAGGRRHVYDCPTIGSSVTLYGSSTLARFCRRRQNVAWATLVARHQRSDAPNNV